MNESTTLVDGLRLTAELFGEERGITYYETTESSSYLSWASIDQRARVVASALQRRGIGPGDMVVVGVGSGLEWPEAVFGVLYAGAAFVPAPISGYGTSTMIGEKVAGIAAAAEATALLTQQPVLDKLGGAIPDVALDLVFLDDLREEGDADAWAEPAIDADSIAYLLFTSGSTGDPKGVIATHGTVMWTSYAMRDLFRLGPDATMVGWSPMHHIMGLAVQAIFPALSGANAVVTSTEQFQRRPMFWLQLISKHRGTMTAAGNFAFGLVTQMATDEQIAELDLSSLISMFSGSEPVIPATVQCFLDRFAPTGVTSRMIAPAMGMTEAMMISAKFPEDDFGLRRIDGEALERGELVPSTADDAVEWVSCGRWPDSIQVRIVDPDTLEVLPDGRVGEIWVSSPSVSPGYFRRPDATAETFGLTLADDDHAYMRTGDLAAISGGELFVTGRLKEMIILRGRNLYPQDIEARSRTVSDAVGIGAAFELAGHPSAVGLVMEYDADALAAAGLDVEALALSVRDEVSARFSLPSLAIAFVEPGMLPRTPTGKVRRKPTLKAVEDGTLPLMFSQGFKPAMTAV